MSVEARISEPLPDTPERIAAAIAAGRTVMWCDWPPLDGTAVAGTYLHVVGWAWCAAGVEEVTASLGERHFTARSGLPRDDVDRSLSGFEGSVSGFALVVDIADLEPRSHRLEVRVAGRDGSAARQSAVVEIGADLPYRTWLERLPAPAAPAQGLRVAVHVIDGLGEGNGLAASLADQTNPNWWRAGGSLGDVLEAVTAGGDPVVLVENRGRLARHALARLSGALGGEPAPDLVYADEDALMPDGERGNAFLKPGWSPELLISTDYVGPVVAVGPRAAAAALATEPHPPETIFELLLRLVDAQLEIERVPEVLFTSDAPRTPADGGQARTAIERLAKRRGRTVQLAAMEPAGMRDVRWELEHQPLVSVVIPTSLAGGRLRDCLRALRERTTYPNLEVVLVDSSPDGLDSIDELAGGLPHRVVRYEGRFNFSAAINSGTEVATGEYILLLNDDTEVQSADWVERMLEHMFNPGVGLVGCKLLYPGGTVQHAGVVLDLDGPGAWHIHWGFAAEAAGYHGLLRTTRNLSAVTAACMLVSADLFAELGGLDESFEAEFSDVDLCLRAIAAGRRVVWTPHAVLTHHERSSFPYRLNRPDLDRFVERWRPRYAGGDPYYHPAFMSLSYEFPPVAGAETFEPPPTTGDEMAKALSEGRTAMWCESPPLDRAVLARGYVDIRGWAHSKAGIAEVSVHLGDLRYKAKLGLPRDDLGEVGGEDLSGSGFELTIELAEDQAGPLELAVVAHGADGQAVGMRGEVECRPGMARSMDDSRQRLQVAEQRLREAEQTLEKLKRSRSWRLTKPLRWGRRVLRRG